MSGLSLGPNHRSIQYVLGAISLEVMRARREADHLLSSVAEVKNDGAIPPFPHTSSWRDDELLNPRITLPLFLSYSFHFLIFSTFVVLGVLMSHEILS
jgi:hypothetical protein